VFALLKSRRWVGFTALVMVSIIGFGLLSRWQWDRADEQRTERLAISQAQVLEAVDSVNDLQEFTRVQISGTFDAQNTKLIRQRPPRRWKRLLGHDPAGYKLRLANLGDSRMGWCLNYCDTGT